MITPDEALAAVLAHAPGPRAARLPLEAAAGHVLAEAVVCDRDYPPFDRAMMDGYGVRAADTPGALRVVAEIPAGRPWDGRIGVGEAVEIMTGAPCPEGVEAVIPVEQTARAGETVTCLQRMETGRNIAPRGSEWHAGAPLVTQGALISPLTVAALASVGATEPLVHARPTVAVITTGDELAGLGQTPAWHQMRDSNGPLLCALLRAADAGAIAMLHASDTEASLLAALTAASTADVIVLTGGVSAGRRDLVPAGAAAAGFETVFHKVAQRPGKPLLFAVKGEQLLFGLPGNPLAVHLCAHRYVAAVLRVMAGRSTEPETAMARLTAPLSAKGERTGFCFATVARSEQGLRVTSLPSVSSADVFTTLGAHALLRVEPGPGWAEGDLVLFEWLLGGHRP